MKLVTVSQMRAIEQEADQNGVTYAQMMEHAGSGLAEIIGQRYGHLEQKNIIGLVGTGNNGGDTLVALEILARDGWQATAYLLKPRPEKDPLVERLQTTGGLIVEGWNDGRYTKLRHLLDTAGVVLDGVLGTGFQLPLKPEIGEVLKFVKKHLSNQVVVAVDCPSGVDCDNGQAVPECIPACLTICMAAVKTGLVQFPAYELAGELEVVDLGLPEKLSTWKQAQDRVVSRLFVQSVMPDRPRSAHKGTFGAAMVVAGSINYTGAAYLAAKATYRIGTGLVRLAVPGPLYDPLAGQLPEATWLILPHEQGVIAEDAAVIVRTNLERITALLLGPGWGMEDTTASFLRQLILSHSEKQVKTAIGFIAAEKGEPENVTQSLPPLVIDADGLKLLVRIPEWYRRLPPGTILTPHPGEMAVLSGLKVEEIQKDRLETARRFAKTWGHIVVLKGALTVVASPDGRLGVIPVATPALAKAGTGDVLAGIITGLLAQGVAGFDAALAGCWIHAQAGIDAACWIGSEAAVLAGDVLDAIPNVLQDL